MYNHFFFILLKLQNLLYKILRLGNNNGFWRPGGQVGAAKKLRIALYTSKHELYVGPKPYAPIRRKYWSVERKICDLVFTCKRLRLAMFCKNDYN